MSAFALTGFAGFVALYWVPVLLPPMIGWPVAGLLAMLAGLGTIIALLTPPAQSFVDLGPFVFSVAGILAIGATAPAALVQWIGVRGGPSLRLRVVGFLGALLLSAGLLAIFLSF
ncbi:hypothetical protein [Hasllibacter sp. MH4015]|uniref:hypothetical protein n=1 Tax=Hasllibacter sp. MH4015 TaxID=2854029 RepID=UPI001CD62405|nr:hypothetical protein [Hasllibacter sp. MH4015]